MTGLCNVVAAARSAEHLALSLASASGDGNGWLGQCAQRKVTSLVVVLASVIADAAWVRIGQTRQIVGARGWPNAPTGSNSLRWIAGALLGQLAFALVAGWVVSPCRAPWLSVSAGALVGVAAGFRDPVRWSRRVPKFAVAGRQLIVGRAMLLADCLCGALGAAIAQRV